MKFMNRVSTKSATLVNRKKLITLLLIVTSCLLACSAGRIGLAPRSIDDEAKAEADKFWATQITRCGDDYYRKLEFFKGGESWYELKDPSVRVSPNVLTEANRLNGLEWHGNIYLETKTSRYWDLGANKWGEWENGVNRGDGFYYRMEKSKGEWHIDLSRYPYDLVSRYVPVDCSKVPR
jgi:hypothetical protein